MRLKETDEMRKERIRLHKTTTTRVKQDKKKYSRKVKHKGNRNNDCPYFVWYVWRDSNPHQRT